MNIQDKLRLEAASERPAFSIHLHNRIVNEIRRESSAIKPAPQWASLLRWPAIAASFLVAAVGVWSALRFTHSSQKSMPRIACVTTPKSTQPPPFAMPDLNQMQINVHDIFTATLWPPTIGITLPLPQELPSSETAQTDPITLNNSPPQWLLAGITQPVDSASTALAEMLPPNLRMWMNLADLHRDPSP